MKINRHIFHVPPFISTSWKAISALHVENKPAPVLIVTLVNGSVIELPPLDEKLIQAIFTIHSQVLEQEHAAQIAPSAPQKPTEQPAATATPVMTNDNTVTLNLPLPPALGNMENMGAFLQHNLEQAQAPDLPQDILEKIASLSKTIGFHDSTTLPKAEPHCNCYYCQIARAMNGTFSEQQEITSEATQEEELVTEEDLKFRLWDIEQTAENLYLVKNPTDIQEHYSVFLGEPIGCTCGTKNCEHIKAVLSS